MVHSTPAAAARATFSAWSVSNSETDDAENGRSLLKIYSRPSTAEHDETSTPPPASTSRLVTTPSSMMAA